MTTKAITDEQACDRTTCPACGSKNIRREDSGCLCRTESHSCWQHPICNDCGYTAGPGGGNSEGGIWIPFSTRYAETYEIEVRL